MLPQDSWVLQTVKGFQNSLCRPTCSASKTSHTMLSIRATGKKKLERERGNICSGRSFSLAKADRVLFKSLPRPQEEWEYEASDKSESPEPVGGNSSLQNGGPANSSRPAEAGRLASQGGLERCLLHGSRPPPLPEVYDRRGDLPVHLPSIWASLRPLGVHQVDENCGDSSQVMGVQNDYLHRWSWQNQLLWSDSTWRSLLIQSEATRIFNMASLSARLLSHFLGKLNAATQAVAPAPLFFRYLQQDLQSALAHGNQDYETLLSLSCQAKEELVWWQENLSKWNGKPFRQKPGWRRTGPLLANQMLRRSPGRCEGRASNLSDPAGFAIRHPPLCWTPLGYVGLSGKCLCSGPTTKFLSLVPSVDSTLCPPGC